MRKTKKVQFSTAQNEIRALRSKLRRKVQAELSLNTRKIKQVEQKIRTCKSIINESKRILEGLRVTLDDYRADGITTAFISE